MRETNLSREIVPCIVSQQASSLADWRMMPDYGLPTYFENHKYMTLCIQQYMTKLETLLIMMIMKMMTSAHNAHKKHGFTPTKYVL